MHSESHPLRVLLVEDNEPDAAYVAAVLEPQQPSVELEHVVRLEQAVGRLGEARFDVVLLDLGLPDSRGVGAVSRVLSTQDTAVVVLTGQSHDAAGADAVRAGAQEFITKGTYDGESLHRAMRYAVERGGRQRQSLEQERRRLHAERLATLGTLAAGVAHEINNPATYILNNLDWLREELDDLVDSDSTRLDELKRIVSECLTGTEKMVAVVQHLSSFSGIEPADVEAADVNAAAKAAVELVLPVDPGQVGARPSYTADVPKRSRVLVIDDNAWVCKTMKRALQPIHDVVVANGGAEGLKLIDSDPTIGAILCDIMMPEVDGVAVHEHIEAHHPHLLDRLIFITGGAFTPRTQHFVESLPPGKVMLKPVRRKAIREVVARLIALEQLTPTG